MYDEGQNAYSVSFPSTNHSPTTDPVKAFRNHDLYKLQSIAGLGSPARSNLRSPQPDPTARQYIARYEVDRRSIFVGNLPSGTTETQIRELFEEFGYIVEVIIRETVSKHDCRSNFTPYCSLP